MQYKNISYSMQRSKSLLKAVSWQLSTPLLVDEELSELSMIIRSGHSLRACFDGMCPRCSPCFLKEDGLHYITKRYSRLSQNRLISPWPSAQTGSWSDCRKAAGCARSLEPPLRYSQYRLVWSILLTVWVFKGLIGHSRFDFAALRHLAFVPIPSQPENWEGESMNIV